MFKFLKRQPDYIRRTDGKEWTRADLIKTFAQELKGLNPVVYKNTITTRGDVQLTLDFLRKEYSGSGIIAYSVSLSVANPYSSSKSDGWLLNLEHYREAVLGSVDEPVAIHADEEWRSSRICRDTRTLYVPLLSTLSDFNSCLNFLEGQEVKVGSRTITKAQIIATYGSAIPFDRALQYFKKTYTTKKV